MMKDRKAVGIAYRFFQSEESRVFAMGSLMLISWVLALALMFRAGHALAENILQMGFAHMLLGRAASITAGKGAEMHSALVAFLAVYLDVMIMFIVYPVLIFSYRNLFERRFFRQHMQPIFDSAQRSLGRMRGFKIVGIFFFVWFPFWMTGIIIGAVIGYLLGLRTWVTMTTVILGSTCAIVSWVYVLGEVFSKLQGVHEAIPGILTIVIILALLVLRFRKRRGAGGKGVREQALERG